ncbi:S-layer homology domain-containing protein [Coprothermobacter platensis]|uniref:S-layer homology domain-containing protein n=1 Tax=Coprothermobacter platensis TaxID=108819 RepID=UPI00037D80D7|nr:S-layer homology domain-containing protein [Coprothermobacter platensis]
MRKLVGKIIPMLLCLTLLVTLAPSFASAATALSIKMDVMQLPSGGAQVMVYVVNPGKAVTMQFNSGYYYDVQITGGNFQYKDSQGKSYTQAVMKKTFPAGNTLISFINLPNIPAGSYTYKVWLVGQNVQTSGSFSIGSVPNITDISNSWAKDNITTVVNNKFLTVLDNKFRPSEPITRGEFMYALALATGLKPVTVDQLANKTNPFKDVDPNNAVAGYYLAFYQKNVVKGFPDGTLRPADYLTRAEAAKLVALTLPTEPGQNFIPKSPFTDLYGHWSKIYVSYLYTKGVVKGVTETTFGPDLTLTRDQVAAFLQRVMVK